MPDWGGKYARHDSAIASMKRALATWNYPFTVETQRRCDCCKQAAPLCAECQEYNRKRDQESRYE